MLLELLGKKYAMLPRRVMSSVRRMKLISGPRPSRKNAKNKNRKTKRAERPKEPSMKLKGKRLMS